MGKITTDNLLEVILSLSDEEKERVYMFMLGMQSKPTTENK